MRQFDANDQTKQIHYHVDDYLTQTKCSENARARYVHGYKLVANTLHKPFYFTCGADGQAPNDTAYLMNIKVPKNRNGEEVPPEEVLETCC